MARRDDAEFVEFAAAARGRLLRTAYLLCGDHERAADLTQEALVKVYVAWPRLQRHGGLLAYARRALVTTAIDHGRRRSSRERPVDRADLDRPTRAHDVAVTDRVALTAALRRLPARQRACVVLRHLEDLSVQETARILDCNEGTVKSQTSHALRALRDHLGVDAGADAGTRPWKGAVSR